MKKGTKKRRITGIVILIVIIALVVSGFCCIKFRNPYKIQELSFETPKSSEDDAYTFDGELITPRDGKKVHPVVIISHGYNSKMENCEDVAKAYADEGYAALVFDFVGGSRKSSTQVHSSQMTTFTEITDYEIVLDYVKKSDAFDQDNVFLSGQSFGGLITTAVAAKHQDEINAVVLFYPAYNMVEDAADVLEAGPAEKKSGTKDNSLIADGELYSWDGLLVSEKYLTELHDMDIVGIIKSIDKDVLILQGDQDTVVPIESTETFLPYFQSVEMVTIEGGEHGFYDSCLTQAEEAGIRFLNAHLK